MGDKLDRLVHVYEGPESHTSIVDDDERWIHFAIDYNRHDRIAISSRIP